MSYKKILCSICARGGSKGVKNKNTRELLGKSLITYTIEQAKETGLFEHIVISSDSDEILNIAKAHGADVFFKRPEKLASDTAGKLDVIRHAFLESENFYNTIFDYHIDLDATSPLRDVEDITNAFNQFIKDDNDILITGANARRSPYFNLVEVADSGRVSLSKTIEKQIFRRQDAPKCFDMNASIYIWKREALISYDTIFVKKTGLYVMPEKRSQDIDSELDFKIVELLMREKNAER